MQTPGTLPRDVPSILKAKRKCRCSGSVWGVHPTPSPGSGWTAGRVMPLLLPTHPLCSVKLTPSFFLHRSSLQTTPLPRLREAEEVFLHPNRQGTQLRRRERSLSRDLGTAASQHAGRDASHNKPLEAPWPYCVQRADIDRVPGRSRAVSAEPYVEPPAARAGL